MIPVPRGSAESPHPPTKSIKIHKNSPDNREYLRIAHTPSHTDKRPTLSLKVTGENLLYVAPSHFQVKGSNDDGNIYVNFIYTYTRKILDVNIIDRQDKIMFAIWNQQLFLTLPGCVVGRMLVPSEAENQLSCACIFHSVSFAHGQKLHLSIR